MNEYQREKFKQTNEVDLAYGVPGLGRFRVNVFQQRGTIGVVFRVIPFKIQSIEQLMLPKVLEKMAGEQRGLILVTGTTGSGKSTTLAAMIDHINATETCHIMTIEDPIEFLIRDKRSIVNQREVGVDTMSFGQALKSALRQDPDVILVGEMRDLETIETALTAAETGHLVMSTLHTLDATETINRIISAFPPYQQKQVRLQLGSVLRGVISQRLVPRADGKGRVPAIEVLLCTTRVREMIEDKDRTKEIPDAISQGHVSYGMQTFDQSLMGLLKAGAHHLRGGAAAGHQPGRLRAARLRHQRHLRLEVGRLRAAGRAGRGRPPRRPRRPVPPGRRRRSQSQPLGRVQPSRPAAPRPEGPSLGARPAAMTTSRSSGSRGRGRKPGRADEPPRERARALALRLPRLRARTEAELRARLARAELGDEADGVVAWLRGLGYLDDVALARARARSLTAPGKLGPRGAERRLAAAGVGRDRGPARRWPRRWPRCRAARRPAAALLAERRAAGRPARPGWTSGRGPGWPASSWGAASRARRWRRRWAASTTGSWTSPDLPRRAPPGGCGSRGSALCSAPS